jgi:hypothetical protein
MCKTTSNSAKIFVSSSFFTLYANEVLGRITILKLHLDINYYFFNLVEVTWAHHPRCKINDNEFVYAAGRN